MHIPDGFLDLKTAAATGVLSVAGVGAALRQLRLRMPSQRVPLMGLTAAFVFVAQMINFPVAGGTSGHLVGGVLAAVLLGPSAAVVVLTSVLVVQCLLFADGGVLALGANIFNMGIINALVGYGIYRSVRRFWKGQRGTVLAAAFAAWCATVLAAIACAGELALSRIVPWSVAFPAMANVHMLIGIGEGLITALVIVAITRVRPDLLEEAALPRVSKNYGELAAFGLLIALGLALFVAPFACPWPDGLEKVATSLGFEHRAAMQTAISSPMPGYHLPWIRSATAATAVAGALGTLVVFGLAFILACALVPKPSPGQP